jgi:hypothetical protein
VPARADGLDRVAQDIVAAHERDFLANRALYDSGEREKSELTLAAERYLNGRYGVRQNPRSGAERQWMRDRVDRARELLAQEVTNADLQAIWWYPEKELYAKLGGESSEALNVDYAGAFGDLVRKRGISDEQIQAAIRSVEGGPRPADAAARQESDQGRRPQGEGAEGEGGPREGRELEQAKRVYEPIDELGRTQLYEGDRAWWDRNWRSLIDKNTPKTAPDMRVLRFNFPLDTLIGKKTGPIQFSVQAAKAIASKHPDLPEMVWRNLPELLANPEAIFPHHEGAMDFLVSQRMANGDPIIVAVRDGQVRTITPNETRDGETGPQRVLRGINAALGRDQKVYVKGRQGCCRDSTGHDRWL